MSCRSHAHVAACEFFCGHLRAEMAHNFSLLTERARESLKRLVGLAVS